MTGSRCSPSNSTNSSARALGMNHTPPVVLVWLEIVELEGLHLEPVIAGEECRPRRDVGDSHNEFPGSGIEVGNRIVIRPFQDERLRITVRGVVGRFDG